MKGSLVVGSHVVESLVVESLVVGSHVVESLVVGSHVVGSLCNFVHRLIVLEFLLRKIK